MPSPPARPGPMPRSRSTSWPATPRSVPAVRSARPRQALISVAGPGDADHHQRRRAGRDGRRSAVVATASSQSERQPRDLVGGPGDRTAQPDPRAAARRRPPGQDRRRGRRSRRPALREMAIASVVITVGAAVAIAVLGQHRLRDLRRLPADQPAPAAQATSPKRRASGGRPSTWGVDGVSLLPGVTPVAVAAGLPGGRRRRHQPRPTHRSSMTSSGLTPANRRRGLHRPMRRSRHSGQSSTRCPTELPPGNAYSETVLAQILLATGRAKRAGEYAAAALRRASHSAAGDGRRPRRGSAGRSDQRRAVGAGRRRRRRHVAGRRAARRSPHVLDSAPELASVAKPMPAFQASAYVAELTT